MSTTSRKISFEAEDNGISSTFEKIQRSAQEMNRELIQEAQVAAASGKEQVKYIEDQIKAIEKRNKLDKQRGTLEANETRDSLIAGGADPKEVSASYKTQIAELNKIYHEDAIQTTILKELLDTSKQSILEQAKIDFESTASQDIEQIPDPAVSLNPNDTEEEENKDDKDDKKKSRSVDDIEREVNSRTTSILNNPIQAIAASIPFIGGAIGMMAALGAQLDASQGRFQATTGRGGTRDSGMAGYGLTTSEYMDRESAILRAQGEFGGTKSLIKQGVAYGLDPGSLAAMSSTERSQVDGKTTSQSLQEMLAVFKKSHLFDIGPDNFLAIEEKVRFQTQLNQMQSEQFEGVSNDVSTRVQQAFGLLGGSFADQRALSAIQNVNRSLSNPDNEYKQAFLYSSLQKIKPDASLFQMKEMQEEGVFQEGYLQQVMEDLVGQAGGKGAVSGSPQLMDMLMTNVKEMLGLNFSQARLMTEQFMSGNADFSKFGEQTSGKFGYSSPAGEIDVLLATIQDSLAEVGDIAIDYVGKQVNEIMDKGFGDYLKDNFNEMVSSIGDYFQQMIDRITEYFEQKWDSVFDNMSPSNWFENQDRHNGKNLGYGFSTD